RTLFIFFIFHLTRARLHLIRLDEGLPRADEICCRTVNCALYKSRDLSEGRQAKDGGSATEYRRRERAAAAAVCCGEVDSRARYGGEGRGCRQKEKRGADVTAVRGPVQNE